MHKGESAEIPFTFLIKKRLKALVSNFNPKPDYTLAPHQNAVRSQKPAALGLEALPVTARTQEHLLQGWLRLLRPSTNLVNKITFSHNPTKATHE